MTTMTRVMRRTLTLALPVLAALAGTAGCATNPVTGGQDFVLMSEQEEIALGREADAQVRSRYGVYDDASLQAYVQSVGEPLALRSHRPELIYRFTVLDSPDVNAFALPGGYIYITRGLMAYLNSEAELAAVLGHEIGHVTARHAVRQYSAAQAAGIGVTLGSIFIPELRTQAAQSLVNILGTSLLRGYGRDQELEADRIGAEYLARTGYEPDAMLEVLEVLKDQEEFEKEIAPLEGREPRVYHGVFATHPSSDERLQEVVGAAKTLEASGQRRVDSERYLRQIDGMVFGDSPAQGVRRGRDFYHAELGFHLRLPRGWRVDNLPDRIEATAPGDEAKILVTLTDRNRRIAPEEFIATRLEQDELRDGRPWTINGHEAYTGIGTFNTAYRRQRSRVTVIYHRDKAYVLIGASKYANLPAFDEAFLDTAASFEPLTEDARELAEGLKIRILGTSANTTIESLARDSSLPNYPERQLRLLNDLYPSGQPAAGRLVKTVE